MYHRLALTPRVRRGERPGKEAHVIVPYGDLAVAGARHEGVLVQDDLIDGAEVVVEDERRVDLLRRVSTRPAVPIRAAEIRTADSSAAGERGDAERESP